MNYSDDIINNINALIIDAYANGDKELDAKKLIKYIYKTYNIMVDDNTLQEVLTKHPNVTEVVDNKIVLGVKEPDEENTDVDDLDSEAVDDAVSDMAKDTVDNNFNESRYYNGKYRLGETVEPSIFRLLKCDNDYMLHYGAIKSHQKYIITEISNKGIQCKIKGSGLFVNIPSKRLKIKKG